MLHISSSARLSLDSLGRRTFLFSCCQNQSFLHQPNNNTPKQLNLSVLNHSGYIQVRSLLGSEQVHLRNKEVLADVGGLLRAAVTGRYAEIVEFLLAEPTIRALVASTQQPPLLHIAAQAADLKTCKLLVDHKADLLQKDDTGRQAIHLVVEVPWSGDDGRARDSIAEYICNQLRSIIPACGSAGFDENQTRVGSDGAGQSALELSTGMGGPNRLWALAFNMYLNRYDKKGTQAQYNSATCEVWQAEDRQGSPVDVALKIITNRDHLATEVEMRYNNGDCLDSNLVHDFLRIHVPAGERSAFTDTHWKLAPEPSEPNQAGKETYVLVMEYADKNLQGAMSMERLAANDLTTVRSVMREVALALQHLHQKGILHADVKPRNIVRCKRQWKLIDLVWSFDYLIM